MRNGGRRIGTPPKSEWYYAEKRTGPRPTIAQITKAIARCVGEQDFIYDSHGIMPQIGRMMFVWACYHRRGMSDPQIAEHVCPLNGTKASKHSTIRDRRVRWYAMPSWLRNQAEMTFDRFLREEMGERIPRGVLLHQGKQEVC